MRYAAVAVLVAAAVWAQVAPESFDSVAARAAAARSAERLEEAIGLYRKAVTLRPAWTEGWWYLSTMLYDRDRYAEARDAFARYVQLDPRSGPGHGLFGICLFNTGDYKGALVELQRGEDLEFGGVPEIRDVAREDAVLALIKLGQFDYANRLLRDYARARLDRPILIAAAGIAALRRPLLPAEVPDADRDLVGSVGQAVWDAGAERSQAADAEFRALLSRYPKAPQLHFLFGSFLADYRPEESLAELEKELEVSPNHAPCLVQIASEYLRRGQAGKALPFAERAVKAQPGVFVTHNILGRVLLAADRVKEATRELEKARDMEPDSPDNHLALGNAYRRAGRREDAAREMEEFARLKKLVEEQRKAPGQQ